MLWAGCTSQGSAIAVVFSQAAISQSSGRKSPLKAVQGQSSRRIVSVFGTGKQQTVSDTSEKGVAVTSKAGYLDPANLARCLRSPFEGRDCRCRPAFTFSALICWLGQLAVEVNTANNCINNFRLDEQTDMYYIAVIGGEHRRIKPRQRTDNAGGVSHKHT